MWNCAGGVFDNKISSQQSALSIRPLICIPEGIYRKGPKGCKGATLESGGFNKPVKRLEKVAGFNTLYSVILEAGSGLRGDGKL